MFFTLPGQGNHAFSDEAVKRAIMLDMADGQSWFVLGNAYLALFFANMETVDHVKQALKAYKKAAFAFAPKRYPNFFANTRHQKSRLRSSATP